jgi:hypothetical protein
VRQEFSNGDDLGALLKGVGSISSSSAIGLGSVWGTSTRCRRQLIGLLTDQPLFSQERKEALQDGEQVVGGFYG